MSHVTYWEQRGIYRKFLGNVNSAEIIHSNREMIQDKRFSDVEFIINDFSQIQGHSITPQDIRYFADTDWIFQNGNRTIKIALVIGDSDDYTLARRYLSLLRESRFESIIVSTLDKARDWVNQRSAGKGLCSLGYESA